MAEPVHLEKIKAGPEIWNSWRKENPALTPYLGGEDLRTIDFRDTDLSNVTFSRSNLEGVNLRGLNLYQAELYRADLRNADLVGANLRGAKLHNADLRGAKLNGADLYRVDFIGTRLDGTIFASARCHATTFASVDLSQAVGLERVHHSGPSNIDVSTLLMMRSRVPVEFLLAAGVPRDVLEQLPYLISPKRAMEFYSCFISYSHQDEYFARKLYESLCLAGLRVWFAPEELKGGRLLIDQIDQAIQVHDKLLLVLSEDSMKSSWVQTELIRAREREIHECRRILFPIRLVSFEALRNWRCVDADSGMDVARELRAYFIPDFSEWHNQEAFARALSRLLQSLQAEDKAQLGSAAERHGGTGDPIA